MNGGGLGLGDPERERALLERIIDTISAGLDLDALVQGVATLMIQATASDVCFVHLVDHEHGRLVLTGATPPFDRLARTISLAIGEGVAGWVAARGEPVVIAENKGADSRYRYIPELRGEDYTSLASVPMVSGPGRVIGVLNVHTRERRDFTEADIGLLRSTANLMAGAVENARLHRELEMRELAHERFAERLIEVQEKERRRLAREIHDGISQRIVSLSFHLSAAAAALATDLPFAAEQIAAARALAVATLDETRSTIAGLRPSVLDDLGLSASLESLARSLSGHEVELSLEDCELPDHLETTLYRIAQEALQNVAKHAQARRVQLRLVRRDAHVMLEIADDGKGFDLADASGSQLTTYGLAGMHERADLVGARLVVNSDPGAGTVVQVILPDGLRGSGR